MRPRQNLVDVSNCYFLSPVVYLCCEDCWSGVLAIPGEFVRLGGVPTPCDRCERIWGLAFVTGEVRSVDVDFGAEGFLLGDLDEVVAASVLVKP